VRGSMRRREESGASWARPCCTVLARAADPTASSLDLGAMFSTMTRRVDLFRSTGGNVIQPEERGPYLLKDPTWPNLCGRARAHKDQPRCPDRKA
jgi:hypothetical protein